MSTEPGSLPARLRELGIRPRKGRGQNFLVSPAILKRIVDAAELTPKEWVIEIGPGPGNLTRLLARSAGRVVAVEVDAELHALLQEELAAHPNVHTILADARQISPMEMLQAAGAAENGHEYKVVANLPYYMTSPILRHFLEASQPPAALVVTVQWEVAKRIVARPPKMSLLSVAVQFYGSPHIVRRVPAGAFYPRPKVDSAIVRIISHIEDERPHQSPEDYFRVVAAGFSQRRKQIRNALAHALKLDPQQVTRALKSAGIAPERRAETLDLADWARLVDTLMA